MNKSGSGVNMSVALQKKIDLAGGVSARLLEMDAFWQVMLEAIDSWLKAYTSDVSTPNIAARVALAGNSAAKATEETHGLVFAESVSPELYAISFNETLARTLAASRLRRATDTLDDIPDVFLKLACEEPARGLWQKLYDTVPGLTKGSDCVSVGGTDRIESRLERETRTLRVAIDFDHGMTETKLFLLFDMEQLERITRGFEKIMARAKPAKDSPAQETLRAIVKQSHLHLSVHVEQIEMSIAECAALEIDDVLPLPGIDMSELTLCAETLDGGLIELGEGELGVWRHLRAIKLTAPLDEEISRELAEL